MCCHHLVHPCFLISLRPYLFNLIHTANLRAPTLSNIFSVNAFTFEGLLGEGVALQPLGQQLLPSKHFFHCWLPLTYSVPVLWNSLILNPFTLILLGPGEEEEVTVRAMFCVPSFYCK